MSYQASDAFLRGSNMLGKPGNVMVGNITFLMIFAVFDLSP